MIYVTIMNTVITLFMTWVWSSKNWTNTIIKFIFFSATVLNVVATFYQSGFIIKI